jgi:hypothetical protein
LRQSGEKSDIQRPDGDGLFAAFDDGLAKVVELIIACGRFHDSVADYERSSFFFCQRFKAECNVDAIAYYGE